MTIGDLTNRELRARLRAGRLRFRLGPFLVAAQSPFGDVADSLALLYDTYSLAPDGVGAHFNVQVAPPSLARRFLRRQAQFDTDGQRPFIPLPRSMAPLMFEAGLNWCVGSLANHLIVIHSATLERNGRGLLMPAPPGSGKSTLCAALVARGWRLLSDEFALIDPASGDLLPVPRPVALKNGSIDVVRAWAPDAQFGPAALNNEGQVVAYMKPPAASVAAADERCVPWLVVVPRYAAGESATMTRMSRARTVLHLAESSFNYNLHGRRGFECLAEIGDRARAASLRYSGWETA